MPLLPLHFPDTPPSVLQSAHAGHQRGGGQSRQRRVSPQRQVPRQITLACRQQAVHERRRGSWHARHSDGKQTLEWSTSWNSKDRALKDGQEEGACVTCRARLKGVGADTGVASGGVAIRRRALIKAKVCTMSPASAKAGMRLRSGSSYRGNRRSAQAGRCTTPHCRSSGHFIYL